MHSAEDETREPMTQEQMQEFMRRVGLLEQQLRTSGAWLFGGALHDADTATVVRVSDGEVMTTDGPFVESKEHLGGFYIIQADNLDAALSWAAKTSAAVEHAIEVRPFRQVSED
jgi:hypothetical protein